MLLFLIIGPGQAADVGAALCKDWELAARTFYRGPNDRTFEFYEEASRWIIGQVLGSPHWPGAKIHEIVDDLFRGSTGDPNAILSDVTQRITDESLDYCRQNLQSSIAGAVQMLLKRNSDKPKTKPP
jgi:hypothetical protein